MFTSEPYSNLGNKPLNPTRVVWDMVSNSSDTNLKNLSYTCPKAGIFGYSIQSANASGSQARFFRNEAVVEESFNAINNIGGLIQVNGGDVVRLYAYGVKGNTSNASAYVCGTFAPY